ncbi:hypothetical protein HELRODRAFT_163254 [Helobdella robusta]|uniref:Uncharacterized protein n=1 Tax=Helobdella robusta TaxID=6412 RepID=T1ETU5_HELRO|nr:hypothetical protein HELRODRAFT_163254 [Helobdella robusta]ESN96213.1 hypothetical protein HELRODRAFT_163254 [Helobdella robusta]
MCIHLEQGNNNVLHYLLVRGCIINQLIELYGPQNTPTNHIHFSATYYNTVNVIKCQLHNKTKESVSFAMLLMEDDTNTNNNNNNEGTLMRSSGRATNACKKNGEIIYAGAVSNFNVTTEVQNGKNGSNTTSDLMV